jgi:hypothetical protein
MNFKMTQTITRYSLDKKIISNGILTITNEGQATHLTFKDSAIKVNASELYHPLVALVSLRKILETEYKSIIGCNGCRVDTAFRPTGGYGTYKIVTGQQATETMNIFEPTEEVDKLCTVDEHIIAYDKWIDSLSKN